MGSDIYAGIGVDVGDAEVWNGMVRPGPGLVAAETSLNGSWNSNTYEGVYSLAKVMAQTSCWAGSGSGEGEVWRWNGASWTKIGGDSFGQ